MREELHSGPTEAKDGQEYFTYDSLSSFVYQATALPALLRLVSCGCSALRRALRPLLPRAPGSSVLVRGTAALRCGVCTPARRERPMLCRAFGFAPIVCVRLRAAAGRAGACEGWAAAPTRSAATPAQQAGGTPSLPGPRFSPSLQSLTPLPPSPLPPPRQTRTQPRRSPVAFFPLLRRPPAYSLASL